MKMCAQRKPGRRQRDSPAVCSLPMVPCGSSPISRLYLAKNEAPEEEAGLDPYTKRAVNREIKRISNIKCHQ